MVAVEASMHAEACTNEMNDWLAAWCRQVIFNQIDDWRKWLLYISRMSNVWIRSLTWEFGSADRGALTSVIPNHYDVKECSTLLTELILADRQWKQRKTLAVQWYVWCQHQGRIRTGSLNLQLPSRRMTFARFNMKYLEWTTNREPLEVLCNWSGLPCREPLDDEWMKNI